MCTATAAGPAFEGGNLSCGVGSVKGAIASAKYLRENFYCETIGGVEPIGICGSGILDIIAQSLEHGLIDESGYILNETGKIEVFANDSNKLYISQKDIREFQLAKAAIRAGIETLILSYGVKYNQIKTVYLAGGFGKYVDINSILKLGILPYELSEKIIKVGNSSLGGATSYLAVNEEKGLKNIREKVSVINLAEEKVFNELLIKYMTFDE
jgi:uncharacterized 2Fe-2S/4Fe-4S cluster protein (DUF4445 family)